MVSPRFRWWKINDGIHAIPGEIKVEKRALSSKAHWQTALVDVGVLGGSYEPISSAHLGHVSFLQHKNIAQIEITGEENGEIYQGISRRPNLFVCVCMCVCERERDRLFYRGRETERERGPI